MSVQRWERTFTTMAAIVGHRLRWRSLCLGFFFSATDSLCLDRRITSHAQFRLSLKIQHSHCGIFFFVFNHHHIFDNHIFNINIPSLVSSLLNSWPAVPLLLAKPICWLQQALLLFHPLDPVDNQFFRRNSKKMVSNQIHLVSETQRLIFASYSCGTSRKRGCSSE